ncbi:MAG: Inner membrane protein YnjF [Chlamydiales bacterium]|nr:Inner membrane protein YnjF [Chlamydiales bacterium]
MLEKFLRPYYQSLFVNPLSHQLLRFPRITPSLITLLSCCLGLLAALFIALHAPYFALLFLVLSGFCDTLDGTLARVGKKCSDLGTTCDILSDRIVEGALILGFYLADPHSRALICIMLLFSILICITSFLVVGIFSENTSSKGFHYSPGLIERAEAFVFFSALILFPQIFSLLGWLFISLVFLTAFVRLYQFSIRQLR